jgi:hypothetical protein
MSSRTSNGMFSVRNRCSESNSSAFSLLFGGVNSSSVWPLWRCCRGDPLASSPLTSSSASPPDILSLRLSAMVSCCQLVSTRTRCSLMIGKSQRRPCDVCRWKASLRCLSVQHCSSARHTHDTHHHRPCSENQMRNKLTLHTQSHSGSRVTALETGWVQVVARHSLRPARADCQVLGRRLDTPHPPTHHQCTGHNSHSAPNVVTSSVERLQVCACTLISKSPTTPMLELTAQATKKTFV